MPRSRVYRNGDLQAEDFPLTEVSEHLEIPGTMVWVDLCAPDVADLEQVAAELGLHELAVEDALNEHQRPKLDRYATHSFISAYSVRLNTTTGELQTAEISVFVLPNALVTVRKDDDLDIDGVVRRWDDSPDLATLGVGAFVYGLLDYLVDGHFEAVQSLDEQIEGLEDLLFDDGRPDDDVHRRSFALRKSLVLLRRVVLPMREVVNSLMRRDIHIVAEELMPYYQDVYDHVLRASEWTESLRDLVSTILETNLTIQGNRLNVISKQVTSWAAIIAVPTAITGFFGQNVAFPGFGDHAGLYWSSGMIVVLSVVLYIAFRRRDWL